jgi:hypothetical protein
MINLNSSNRQLMTSSKSQQFSATLVTIAELLRRCRFYLFAWVKDNFIAKTMTSTGGGEASSTTKFELVISRSRALKFVAQGEVDNTGRWSVFGQIFRRVHGMPASTLRRTGQLWETVFAGERSHDSGGPYREAWSALTADVMSATLPLLKPCANNEHKVGFNQETYVLNPDCASNSTQLEMLTFLGKLMGSAARSSNYLDLFLAPLVWKLLVSSPITLEDIRDVDVASVNNLNRYQAAWKSGQETAFAGFDLHFSIMNKGGTVVELHPGGSLVIIT